MPRAYVMGYEPPGVDMDELGEAWIEERIAECDFCFTVTNGHELSPGDVITALYDYGTGGPGPGTEFVVVALEHFGKVVVLAQLEGN